MRLLELAYVRLSPIISTSYLSIPDSLSVHGLQLIIRQHGSAMCVALAPVLCNMTDREEGTGADTSVMKVVATVGPRNPAPETAATCTANTVLSNASDPSKARVALKQRGASSRANRMKLVSSAPEQN